MFQDLRERVNQLVSHSSVEYFFNCSETPFDLVPNQWKFFEVVEEIPALVEKFLLHERVHGVQSIAVFGPFLLVLAKEFSDDYLLTDSRQLAFTSTGWPTITGATVKLRVKFGKNATVTEYTATVTGAQACYVPLTTVQTAAMVPGVYKFDLQATLVNLSIVTLVQGTLSVWEDVR